jgi:histidinol phosphatase-like PHP family hydrolase
MTYGVSIAKRGWLEKDDILNTMSYNSLLRVFQKGKM